MIRYALKCSGDHAFDSWFQSAEAFESLVGAGMVECPTCGSHRVEKSVMTPQVRPSRKTAVATAKPPDRPLRDPRTEAEAALDQMRRHVEKNSDYVGLRFASEARKMHDGEIPHRSIYGEAKSDEAKKLIEDGVPVAPLPFVPQRKTN